MRSWVQAALTLASLLAPRARAEWLQAMRAEAQYVSSRDVAAWTIGCVVAAVKMRFLDMFTLERDVSRPVLVVEVLLCFGSLVFAGFQYMRILLQFPSFALRLDPGAVIIAGIVVGVAGAFGIAQGLRQVVSKKSVSNSLPILVAVPVGLFTVAMLAVGGTVNITREVILLSILPILGALHLHYLGSRRSVAR